MATIINNPPPATTPAPSNNSNGPIGMIIALIVLLVIAYFGFVYVLPAIRHIQVGSPQVNVPSKIDVNVHQAK